VGRVLGTYEGKEKCIKYFGGEIKRPLEKPRRRWENNIKLDLQEQQWSVNLTYLAQDRDKCRTVVNTVMNCRVP
jgi:hypothetical protein